MTGSGFVIVSGLPASGKTALGREVAARFAWPMLDKDDFLEARFARCNAVTPELRQRLSRESDAELTIAAQRLASAVLVSFWRPRGETVTYGTPTDWIDTLSAPVIELHCRCAPATARARFIERTRHPGHNDDARLADLAEQFEDLAALGPLGGWPCVEVDTTDLRDRDAIADDASARLAVCLSASV